MNLVINGNNLIGFDESEESRNALIELGYSEEQINAEFAQQKAIDFYNSEREKAIQIFNDHYIGIGLKTTDETIEKVKLYMASINPHAPQEISSDEEQEEVERPDIFNWYDNNF